MSLLRTESLTMRFGGLVAVSNLDLTVNESEIVGLIGPNGSGKTTVFNVISGFYPPAAGDVYLKDEKITGRRPYLITEKGIARTFQNIRLFKNLTVLENVLIGRHSRIRSSLAQDVFATRWRTAEERRALERVQSTLDLFGLTPYKNEKARNLPYGMQRRLEIVRALASDPIVLLLDEPAAGMNPIETDTLMNLILEVRASGVTILLVEHDMKVVMGVSDRVIVLNHGEKIAEGTPAAVQRNELVIEAYLGKRGKEYAHA